VPTAAPLVADDSCSKPKSVGCKNQIQRVHLDHFTTLFCTSRYRAFNWSVGLGEGPSDKQEKDKDGREGKGAGRNLSLVRRILFALQMGWYNEAPNLHGGSGDSGSETMSNHLIDTLGVVLRAPGGFERDDIKAVVAYIAANLSEGWFFCSRGAEGSSQLSTFCSCVVIVMLIFCQKV